MLSSASRSVWAKSIPDATGQITHWLPLHQHLDDTEAVAGMLFDHWLPHQVISRIGEDLPDGPIGARRLTCWLAAVHDVGKASPAFAVQVPTLADRMRDHGLVSKPSLAKDPTRSAVSHALVGHLAVREWLVDELGFTARKGANQWAVVVGGHHGVPPEDGQLIITQDRGDLRGTGRWQQTRRQFLERAAERVGGRESLAIYRDAQISQPSQVLLTAIVIVADWIASNTELFPVESIETARITVGGLNEEQAARITRERVRDAWAKLALPPGWSARPVGSNLDDLVAQRFDIPGAHARPVQRAAVEVARGQSHPGMLIVEAPMGEGKTEAALLAAEILAHKSGAGGIFVALPTQATSNAMFDRVLTWLRALPDDAGTATRTVNLAHGKATLNDDFAGLVRAGRFISVGDDETTGRDRKSGSVIAHQWLSGRKKGVLASFVVGTIDQVLFAGLKSRHLALRHLALAGKVVIIDEVHAYDIYMSQYLDRVLHWLGSYGVPVVLLSATLPPGRRGQMLDAYDSGRGIAGTSAPQSDSTGYPVVMGTEGSCTRTVRDVEASARSTSIHLDHLSDDPEALVTYLREHLAGGGCAVVIRNTVTRVQETALLLEGVFGEDTVTVAHARFLSCDRARIDRALLARFGPPGDGVDRPRTHIVVASQVVEQSLDVDFDLMITDLAPVDLVLQRMGRVHRHRRGVSERGRPAGLQQARCALVGVEDWAAVPVVATAGSRRVYDDYALLRSAALLGPSVRTDVVLPKDISPLVQTAYGDDEVGPADWRPAMTRAREKSRREGAVRAERADSFRLDELRPGKSLINWLRAGVGDVDDSPRGTAQVRDGGDSLEVLVVQRDTEGGLHTPSWIEKGSRVQLPTDLPVEGWQARIVAACSLRLPPALCYPTVIDDVITALETDHIMSFHQSALLKDELVLVLDEHRTAILRHGRANFQLTYDPRRGLIHERL